MRRLLCVLSAVVACGTAFAAAEYRLENTGRVTLGGGLYVSVSAAPRGWKGEGLAMASAGDASDGRTGTVRWRLCRGKSKKAYAAGKTTLLPLADGRTYVRFDITMSETFETELLMASVSFPARELAGAPYEAGDVRDVFPKEWEKIFPVSGSPERLALDLQVSKRHLVFDFPSSTSVQVQDDRKWAQSFSLRIAAGWGHCLEKGRSYSISFILGGESAKVSYAGAFEIVAGPDWLPLDVRKEVVRGSAADFSHLPFRDAPAGKHGWLRNEGGHFAFASRPDRPQRFWGVNLCGPITCPQPDDADRLLDRFEKAGYNSIRIHHYERTFVGKSPDRLTLDPAAMARFDSFFAKAKARGFYFTTDLFVSRDVHWRDIGIDRDGPVDMSVVKGLFAAHEPAFENWCRFAENFLTHVNPHTGLRYMDDPAMPFLVLVNEGVFAWQLGAFDTDPVRARWKTWLEGKKKENPAWLAKAPADCKGHALGDWKAEDHPALVSFICDVEADFVTRAKGFLRGLGVKAMLSDWNCGFYYDGIARTVTNALDYADMHLYVDHPSFLLGSWGLPAAFGNSRPDRVPGSFPMRSAAIAKRGRMPFTVSEWNYVTPGSCRGTAGLLAGACADRCDWDAMWRFNYAGNGADLRDDDGAFSFLTIANDPFQVASDRAGALLFLRGQAQGVGAQTESFPVSFKKGDGRFEVVTRHTAGGFGSAGDAVEAGPLSCRLAGSQACVWASAVAGDDLATADRILVTHLTDLQRNGIRYSDDTRTTLLKWGHGPFVVRRGTAEMSLALAAPETCEVWALALDGSRTEKLPSSVREGKLAFTADVRGSNGRARCLYEIVRKTSGNAPGSP